MELKLVPLVAIFPTLPCRSRVANFSRLCKLKTSRSWAPVVSTSNSRPFIRFKFALPFKESNCGSNGEPFHSTDAFTLPCPPSTDFLSVQWAMSCPAFFTSISKLSWVCSDWFWLAPFHWPVILDSPSGLIVWIESILSALLAEIVLILNWPSCALNQEKSSIDKSRLGMLSGLRIFLFEVLVAVDLINSVGTSGTRRRLNVPESIPLGLTWLGPWSWIWPLICGALIRICNAPVCCLTDIFKSSHIRSIKVNFLTWAVICRLLVLGSVALTGTFVLSWRPTESI